MNKEEYIKERMIQSILDIRWDFHKVFRIGRCEIIVEKRSKDNFWGRFGGGWNWDLGFQIGGRTLIINWLIGSIIINLKRK